MAGSFVKPAKWSQNVFDNSGNTQKYIEGIHADCHLLLYIDLFEQFQ